MKSFLALFIFIYSISNLFAQDKNLIGTWNIIEFTVTHDNTTEISKEDKLKEDSSVWKLILMEDGEIKQSSNMRTGEVESWDGTWKTSEDSLTLKLNMNSRDIALIYQYKIEDDVLVLTRSNPMGTMKIVSKFRKE